MQHKGIHILFIVQTTIQINDYLFLSLSDVT